MRLAAQVFFVLGLFGWEVFGHPKQDIVDCFWPNGPAPWERVDAFYYPDRGSLTASLDNHDVGGLTQCRVWVRSAAATQNDAGLERGDYECGVGYLYSHGPLNIYRLTMR
jgi:hypothetical protein